jgi:hypothetical protein
MRMPRPFIFKGSHLCNVYGEWCQKGSVEGFGDMTSKEMRRLAAWLIRSADWLDWVKK